jgi:pseudouridine-5'-phosphate glycosidase
MTNREHSPIRYTNEVREALEEAKPVVALESTIISHGMPYPQNRDTARSLEAIVREHGAVPATIAIRDGEILCGLEPDDLEFFATSDDVAKASRRDMAAILAGRQAAATTVSATMIAAHRCGVSVFATGGIGGVHRGGETTWDVSADLEELSRTPVTVVSAGAKAILDIPRTLEYLETKGVPILGYGTDRFPAFYTRDSGFPVDYALQSPAAIAAVIRMQTRLELGNGILVANPVPRDEEADPETVATAISTAIDEAEQREIRGKELTPFLLGRLYELTAGTSLVTNIALVENNARLAAGIATELSRRE